MSVPADDGLPEVSDAVGIDGQDDEFVELAEDEYVSGEESDEYDLNNEGEGDVAQEEEEEEEEEYDEEEGPERQTGLTEMLLGNPNATEEEEEEEVEGDEEYVEGAYVEEVIEEQAPATTNNKKRSITDLAEDAGDEGTEESEAKKVKA